MPIVTSEELAKTHLKCSPGHVKNLRDARLIPFIKMGKRAVRYDLDAVKRALEKLTIREVS